MVREPNDNALNHDTNKWLDAQFKEPLPERDWDNKRKEDEEYDRHEHQPS